MTTFISIGNGYFARLRRGEEQIPAVSKLLGGRIDAVDLDVSMLAENEHCATLNLNISFLRPATAGSITGRFRRVRRGKGVCHVYGELAQAGKQIATATATCMVVTSRDARSHEIAALHRSE